MIQQFFSTLTIVPLVARLRVLHLLIRFVGLLAFGVIAPARWLRAIQKRLDFVGNFIVAWHGRHQWREHAEESEEAHI